MAGGCKPLDEFYQGKILELFRMLRKVGPLQNEQGNIFRFGEITNNSNGLSEQDIHKAISDTGMALKFLTQQKTQV